ncbi:CHAD domain-containing protein [Jatrophihabitans sp.]|uniref:CHAD domain-containing protein n=1 Tax=Jatrophihabitans sp. TaxID=1932789 RepID=UPI0030C74C8D|nr:hypothetical protein [Jatrophihabitans sp.]
MPRDDELRSLHALIASYLQTQRLVIVRGDVALRHGEEAIHRTRVAIRRYRSVLRVFATEFPAAGATALDAELTWYAEALGGVRDLHVLGRQLTEALDSLSTAVPLAAAREAITVRLDRDVEQASASLSAALASPRYDALLVTLDAWQSPPFVRPDRAAKEVVQYVDAADRKVTRRLRKAARADVRDEALHRARKAGKRARYAAEVSRPVLGAAAKTRIRRAKQLQDRLGQVQDTSVALEFVQSVALDPSTSAEAAFALGLLWAYEQRRQTRAIHHVE